MPSDTFILALSGPSSSGKTTLARLIRTILTNPTPSPTSPSISAFILHEDDFYVTDTLIPVDLASGLREWDCAAAIDVPALISALKFIKENGKPPDELVSKEDKNNVGDSGVSESEIAEFDAARKEILKGFEHSGSNAITIAIVDGFLLYAPPSSESTLVPVLELLDIKLFLRTDYGKMKERRERRKGYVTLEGFWEDPPAYVDKIVWPNYVRNHEWMFTEGNVDNGNVRKVVGELGIQVAPGKGEINMKELLSFAMNSLEEGLLALSVKQSGEE